MTEETEYEVLDEVSDSNQLQYSLEYSVSDEIVINPNGNEPNIVNAHVNESTNECTVIGQD